MLFSWLKKRRRRQLLAAPFPPEWQQYLERNVVHYRHLAPEEQTRLRDDLRIFLAEKHWEGCGGLTLTDEMKVTISALACLLTLNLEPGCYDRIQSILVYPGGYEAVTEDPDRPFGSTAPTGEAHLGEAWYRGPVILSWQEIRDDARHPSRGHNLVYHEFAHQLDMLDGTIDGTPPLRSREEYKRWHQVMTEEYNALVDASEHHRATLLDQYGTTNEGEFFAVATECFFDRPVQLARRHPRLYEVLRDYYRQDPATRCGHQASGGC